MNEHDIFKVGDLVECKVWGSKMVVLSAPSCRGINNPQGARREYSQSTWSGWEVKVVYQDGTMQGQINHRQTRRLKKV